MTLDEFIHTFRDNSQGAFTLEKSRAAIEIFLKTVYDLMVAHDSIMFKEFGTLGVKEWKARKGRNPQTGEDIPIPAKMAPLFKPCKALRDEVAGK